MSNSLRYARFN